MCRRATRWSAIGDESTVQWGMQRASAVSLRRRPAMISPATNRHKGGGAREGEHSQCPGHMAQVPFGQPRQSFAVVGRGGVSSRQIADRGGHRDLGNTAREHASGAFGDTGIDTLYCREIVVGGAGLEPATSCV